MYIYTSLTLIIDYCHVWRIWERGGLVKLVCTRPQMILLVAYLDSLYIYIYVVYKLRFCTSYNLYKNIVQVITCTTQKYKLKLVQF
jgi:hypothetical protein